MVLAGKAVQPVFHHHVHDHQVHRMRHAEGNGLLRAGKGSRLAENIASAKRAFHRAVTAHGQTGHKGILTPAGQRRNHLPADCHHFVRDEAEIALAGGGIRVPAQPGVRHDDGDGVFLTDRARHGYSPFPAWESLRFASLMTSCCSSPGFHPSSMCRWIQLT